MKYLSRLILSLVLFSVQAFYSTFAEAGPRWPDRWSTIGYLNHRLKRAFEKRNLDRTIKVIRTGAQIETLGRGIDELEEGKIFFWLATPPRDDVALQSYAIQFALKLKNLPISHVPIEMRDEEGNAASHYLYPFLTLDVGPRNFDIIEWANAFKNVGFTLEEENHAGETPIFSAFRAFLKNPVQAHSDFFRLPGDKTHRSHNGETPFDLRDENENTVLHWARTEELIELAISSDTDLDVQNANGETPFISAMKRMIEGPDSGGWGSDLNTAKALAKGGANTRLRDNNGISGFDYLDFEEHLERSTAVIQQVIGFAGEGDERLDEFVDRLLDTVDRKITLNLFSVLDRNRNLRSVQALQLATLESVQETDRNGNTLLHLACENGDQRLIREVIRVGADIHAVNEVGETAFHIAARKADLKSARLLLAFGADFDAVSKIAPSKSPLALVYETQNFGWQEMRDFLQELGADEQTAEMYLWKKTQK